MLDLHAEIYQEHLGEAAFLWLMRDRAVVDAAYDLDDICALDERVEAHLDGLRLGGEKAWALCEAELEDMEEGEAFVAMALAVHSGVLERVAKVLDVGGAKPETARAMVSGLGWASRKEAEVVLPGLLYHRCPPALHFLGIAGSVGHRLDPGSSLGFAIFSEDLRLRSRALRAVGELRRFDLLKDVVEAMHSEDAECRFAAAWSAAFLGKEQAHDLLWDIARSGGANAEAAAASMVRSLGLKEALARLDVLRGIDWRVAVRAAAALGSARSLPWLFEALDEPEKARLAGHAIAQIAGLPSQRSSLHSDTPEGFLAGPNDDADDDDVALDPDESHPWLERGMVERWCQQQKGLMQASGRLLLGKAMTSDWLQQVLAKGDQIARASAAIELARGLRGKPFAEVRAPGFRQRKRP